MIAAVTTVAVTCVFVLAAPKPGGGGGQTPIPQGPTNIPANTIVPTTAPIYLPGNGSVTDTGGATYSLPLWVPDGPQGMQPSLAIAYSGHADGVVGVGFGLTGLSSIAPCNTTFASEGLADNANFTTNDAYCLDGQKLVEHTEPDFDAGLGGSDRGYHTELESFAYIVAHRTDAKDAQPERFIVRERNGNSRTYLPIYGYQQTNADARSRPEAGKDKVAVVYLLADTTDRHGNRVEYSYDTSGAVDTYEITYRLQRIDYSFAGASPRRHVDFTYEDRPDPRVRYHRGFEIGERKRLKRIDAYAPNPDATAPVWSYRLAYQTSGDTGNSLLASVNLCDAANVCSFTRSFEWTTVSPGPGVQEHVIADTEFGAKALGYDQDSIDWYQSNPSANWFKPNDTRVVLYDMDGDGDDDALYRTAPSWPQYFVNYWAGFVTDWGYVRRAGKLTVRLSSEQQPLELQKYDVTRELEPGWDAPFNSPGDVNAFINLGKTRIADIDNDGRPDLMLARTRIEQTGTKTEGDQKSLDTWQYGFRTIHGRAWDHFSEKVFKGDVGQLDMSVMHGPVMRADDKNIFPMLHQPSFQRVLADLDGDGKVDALDAVDQDIDVRAYPGVDWDDPYSANGGVGFPYHGAASSDGQQAVFAHHWTCGNGLATVSDLDGDGRSDVLITSDSHDPNFEIDPVTGKAGVYRKLSLADAFSGIPTHGPATVEGTSKLWAGDCTGENPDLVMGDFNGDGLADALYPPGSYGGNTLPLVRWNIGTGFGPNQTMPINGAPGIAALMEQKVPVGRQGSPVRWDRGTRVADLNGDGRSDIIAVRQDNTQCVDPIKNVTVAPPSFGCDNKVVVYLSRGDHFEGSQIFTWQNAMATISNGFSTVQLGDTNGDGAMDLVHVAGGKLRVLELPWRQTPDLLAKVHDTSASYALETFEYSRAWWGDKPRLEATQQSPTGPAPCAWPLTCPASGFPVVRRHQTFQATRTNGAPMYAADIHHFASPVTSLLGRGSLGFASHRIWQRERGIGTERIFDNKTSVDPAPQVPGGLFYPYAGAPKIEVSVTPRVPAATDAEIASSSFGPGLVNGAYTPVRTRWSSYAFELRDADHGRILTLLPKVTDVTEVDTSDRPQFGTATPSYSSSTMVGDGNETITTATYDAYGNATEQVTEIKTILGNLVATRRATATFENRLKQWHLGLVTSATMQSYDSDDTRHPERIKRSKLDANGDVASIQLSSRDDAGAPELAGTTTEIVYDAVGNQIATTVSAVDDPTPRTAEVEYDAEGIYPTATTDALGVTSTTLIHPAYGVPVVITDALGVTTVATYDGFGRLRGAARPGAASLARTFAAFTTPAGRRGLEVHDIHSDGSEIYRKTDELGRSIELGRRGFNSAWSYSQAEYDGSAFQARVSQPAFALPATKWTVNGHDRLGQIISKTEPDGATTVIEPSLLETRSYDPEGHETYVKRDFALRTSETGTMVNSAPYGVVKFTVGPFDQVERVRHPSGPDTVLVHDSAGRLLAETDPDSGTIEYGYDGFGQLIDQQLANGDKLHRTYDVLGRLVLTEAPEGKTVRTYGTTGGENGRLVSVEAPDARTDVSYDSYGRTHEIAQTVDGIKRSLVHRYDALGRLRYVFYPEAPGIDRLTVRYAYGNDGLVHTLDDVSQCHVSTDPNVSEPLICSGPRIWQATSRDAALRLTGALFGNNQTESRTYDPFTGRITKVAAQGSITSYGYNEDGQLVTRTDVQSGRAESFAYDDLHRLVGWHVFGGKEKPTSLTAKYQYDELGNLVDANENGTTAFKGTFGAQGRPHALAWSSTGGAFDYDEGGRQISGDGRNIEWTSFDQPSRIISGHEMRDFRYDGGGGRVSRYDSATKVGVTYLGRFFEHRETPNAAARDTFFVYGDPGLVAQIDVTNGTKTTRYVVEDPLGSTSLVMGTTDERAYFSPFGARVDTSGKPIVDPDPTTTRGFTGHEEDDDRLVNMQGRIYDRAQYRFISPDPKIPNPLDEQAYNPYAYVYNSPLDLRDSTGFEPDGGYPVPGTVSETTDATGHTNIELNEMIIIGQAPGQDPLEFMPPMIGCDGMIGPRPVDGPVQYGWRAPREPVAIPNIVERKPWAPPTPISDYTIGLALDSKAPWYARIAGGVGSIFTSLFIMSEQSVKATVIGVQAPFYAFDAYEQHHQRALALERVGADDAATMEWLGAAQSFSMGIADSAGLILMFTPAGSGAKIAQVAPEAEGPVVLLLDGANASKNELPAVLDGLEAGQWTANVKRDAYSSTAEQFLYIVTRKSTGETLKYGTTFHEKLIRRYGSDKAFQAFFKEYREGFPDGEAVIELVTRGSHGNARFIRATERGLIQRFTDLNGRRPAFNPVDH